MSALAIQSIGAITAAGDDVPGTMASILSELQLFDEIDATGSDGEPLTGAATAISRSIGGVERLGALGLIALTECASAAPSPFGPAPLILCAPDVSHLTGDLLERVTADARLDVDRKRSRVIARGRAGMADALAAVEEILHGRRQPACYLVGVDCLIERGRAEALDREGRIFNAATGSGFIPGEAAAALLLAARSDRHTMASIGSVGFGEDSRTSAGDGPVTGSGLSTAVERALKGARLDAARLAAFAHDGSGSRVMAEELTLSTQRPPLDRMGEIPVFSPSLSTGEVGAAAGPLVLSMLAFYMAEAEIRGPALAALLSEEAHRCAVVVTPTRQQGS